MDRPGQTSSRCTSSATPSCTTSSAGRARTTGYLSCRARSVFGAKGMATGDPRLFMYVCPPQVCAGLVMFFEVHSRRKLVIPAVSIASRNPVLLTAIEDIQTPLFDCAHKFRFATSARQPVLPKIQEMVTIFSLAPSQE